MAEEKRTETAGQTVDIRTFADRIKHYMERAYPYATVEVHTVRKNNNVTRTAVTIMEKGCNAAPSIYLEDLFGQYQNGKSLEEICRSVVKIHQSAGHSRNFDVKHITDFDAVRDKICYRLVNAKRYASPLQNVPHRLWQDLAVVYHISAPVESAGSIASIMIQNRMLEMWKVDENTLYEHARMNTPALFQPEIVTLDEMLDKMLDTEDAEDTEDTEDTEDAEDTEDTEDMPPVYVATNSYGINGAAVILYEGLLEKFARQINSDFYIIPGSIHETLFMPVLPDTDECRVKAMLHKTNTVCLAPEEILSYNVYCYHAKDNSVRLVS